MRYLIVGLIVFILWFGMAGTEPPAKWEGCPVPETPEQTKSLLPDPWEQSGFTIKPLARYRVKAVVLSAKHYYLGRESSLSPVDLALGWGPMSQPEVINKLDISQDFRWYNYRWKDEPPIPVKEIVANSANTHCIPEDVIVKRKLMDIKRHDLVDMEGYLVRVEKEDGWRWVSSLTRNDSGAGSCEVFVVTSVEVTKP
jgi:hypothetical protein